MPAQPQPWWRFGLEIGASAQQNYDLLHTSLRRTRWSRVNGSWRFSSPTIWIIAGLLCCASRQSFGTVVTPFVCDAILLGRLWIGACVSPHVHISVIEPFPDQPPIRGSFPRLGLKRLLDPRAAVQGADRLSSSLVSRKNTFYSFDLYHDTDWAVIGCTIFECSQRGHPGIGACHFLVAGDNYPTTSILFYSV
jgi:hypothetical protein